MAAKRPWRAGVAVATVGGRPSEVDGVPVLRPLALLRDRGFAVHAIARGPGGERATVDGVDVYVEPDNVHVARRIAALRPELLFVESIAYAAVFGPLARRSWIRNPLPAVSAQLFRIQRAAVRRFDAVSFTNPADAGAWAFRRERHVDLAYPLDVAFWSTPVERRESWWTERGWPVPTGPVLVCNAAYARRKRVGELLEMLAPWLSANRSAVLVFVGHQFVEPDVTEQLKQRPEALGVGEQVLTTGWMSAGALRELLAWASVSVINSSWETQCLAVYESLAAGVPTLISSIPVLTSQFPQLPAHSDAGELHANLESVLADADRGRGLIESTRARVEWADVHRHDEIFDSALTRLVA